jgi:hypothetical protein
MITKTEKNRRGIGVGVNMDLQLFLKEVTRKVATNLTVYKYN